MKKRLGQVLLLLLISTIGLAVVAQLHYKLSNYKNKKDEIVATPEEPEMVDGYTYSEVETAILELAKDDEQKSKLRNLVDPLNKSQVISCAYLKAVTEILGVDSNIYSYVFADAAENTLVDKNAFDVFYNNLVILGSIEGISRKDVFIFEKTEENDPAAANMIVSDGNNEYEIIKNIYSDEYLDKSVNCYVKGNYIYRVNGLSDSSFTLKNVWIKEANVSSITFLYNNVEKSYICDVETDENAIGVADIEITNGRISKISKKNCDMEARVTEIRDNAVTVENKGTYEISPDFRCYDITGRRVECEDSIGIFRGYDSIQLETEGDKICAAVIDKELNGPDIRVIICNDDYSSYEHKTITMRSDSDYIVTMPDGTEITGTADETFSVSEADYMPGDIISFEPVKEDSLTVLQDVKRASGNPSYTGSFKIYISEECLYVVNITKVEKYLYSVVSSEISPNAPIEALKAQAICARGYAYGKVLSNSYEDYNADIDDSSMCQVYNNQAATKETEKAVKDTYGIVCTYENLPIMPFYYSTSFGTSCTNDEIWGGSSYDYLRSNVETLVKEKVNLSTEEAFDSFLSDSMGYDTIEKDMPLYRWSIEFTFANMTAAIAENLSTRIEASPENILIKDEIGNYVPFESSENADIGEIQDILVSQRSRSGVVEKLIITGSKGEIEVSGQTNIRNLITPEQCEIKKQDGTVATGWTSLPSPYYKVEKIGTGFVISGGGFGHGVGMSQNGASELALLGYNYRYILNHYFSYIDIEYIYNAWTEGPTTEETGIEEDTE